ncbi:zinc finger BED domain-containing protein 1-like, partial [Oxyura jamaicensis]|uniref:zinc finger BED domain-containing protein 1-like n=1 Tax=Oxyura jamaicensis TaxID=8884 RepID=UPI0015A536C1
EVPTPLGAYGAAAASPGPAWRRRREKSGGPEAAGGALSADRRKSKVWNYYTKLGDAYVECTVCRKQLSFHNSTTTMREHLARRHSIRDAPLRLKDEAPEAKRPRQTPPESGPRRGAPCGEARSEVILELVLEMIFRDLQPLSVVRDRGFGLLLGYLEPAFVLPAPARLAGMLRHRYGVVKQQVERSLRTAQALVVCLEAWASRRGHGYLGISASFIDGEWRRARCLLETQRARRDEGGVGERLRAALAEFGLPGQAVFCVVDDSSEPPAGQGWAGLCCAARALQLCVQAGLEVEQVQEALSGARGIVRFFEQDAEASGCLGSKLEALNKSQLKLALDAGSRWLTTVEMCENLLELRWAIMAVLEEHPRGAAAARSLADHQWKLLQELVAVLRTVKIAASFLREEQNASVSALMPCVHGVVAAIGRQAEEAGAVVRRVVGNIRAELTRRWGLAEEEKVLESPAVIASFLDPRFKELRFLSPGLRSELHRRVKAMLSQAFGHQSPPGARSGAPGSGYKAEGEAPEEPSAPSASAYDVLLGKDPTESMPEIHRQLENYIVEPLCKRSADPLDWWRSNEHRFPAVARLSRRYLAVPATAVPPERAFAAGESALQHRRAALAPENLHQVLFLHHNFDLLEARRSGQRHPR